MTGSDGNGGSGSASSRGRANPAIANDSEKERLDRAEDARRFGCGLLTLFIFPPAFIAWVIWDAVTSLQKGLSEAEEDDAHTSSANRQSSYSEKQQRDRT